MGIEKGGERRTGREGRGYRCEMRRLLVGCLMIVVCAVRGGNVKSHSNMF